MNLPIIQVIIAVLCLPLLLIRDLLRAPHSGGAKFWYLCLILLFFGLTWQQGYRNVAGATALVAYHLGAIDKQTNLPVRGTSMTPTILDGSTIDLHNPNKFGLERGDIVSFQNIETSSAHYLKRLIGLPGETITIKNGRVYINDQALSEPYVNHGDATFGNTFLIDCTPYKIPAHHYAVLGDNRTVSVDSRVLGFIDHEEIDGVIKPALRPTFATTATTPPTTTFDPAAFIEGLNQKRLAQKSLPLAPASQLQTIAAERAAFVGSHFSNYKTDAAPISTLLDQVGYKYLLVQEMVTFGSLSAEQLQDQILESSMYKEAFLSNQYVAIGIGTASLKQSACTIPVIVAIVAKPVSPGYDQATLDKWQHDLDIMTRIATALKAVQYKPGVDFQQAGKLLDQVNAELAAADQNLTKLNNQQWFTTDDIAVQEKYLKDSQATQNELETFITESKKVVKDPDTLKLLDQIEPGGTATNQ